MKDRQALEGKGMKISRVREGPRYIGLHWGKWLSGGNKGVGSVLKSSRETDAVATYRIRARLDEVAAD